MSDALISSHCPGWSLYAEKVVDAKVIPKLSQVASPPHLQGFFVK